MNLLIQLASFAALAVVLMRTVHQIAHLDHRTWVRQRIKFAAFSFSIALICGGALGAALNLSYSHILLLFGVAGWFFFDRRGDRLK